MLTSIIQGRLNYYYAVVQRVLGLLLMIFSVSMLAPIVVALIYGDGEIEAFAIGFAITLATGLLAWLPSRHVQRELKIRDGFLVVVLFWMVLSLFGAIPLWLATRPDMNFTDAAFESVSGLTTTGATVLTGLDTLPHAILFWRVLLHWMGGMGIIVLAVAVLPMLGVGGMQLYRAETPGPIKDAKLTPRIRETAKALWYVYVSLTLFCALLFWAAGTTPFDAISDAFSSIATGGFSNHDLSLGYHDNPIIELAACVSMLIGAISFGMHFSIWRSANLLGYWRDSETRTFLIMVVAATAVTAIVLLVSGTYVDAPDAVIKALFQVLSIGTTTGFTTTDYTIWPSFIPMFLLLGGFIGGCAGSTTGGMKTVRFILLAKQGTREISRLVHPNAEIPIKMGGKVIPDRVVHAVWGFFSVYVTVFALMFLILLATGLNELTSFSAVAATINNVGPGLGSVASNMAGIPTLAKWVLCLSMLLGRLEVFTLLVILTPAFWRR
ncbi:TrkH family potassium uptake protein [Salinisphaera sp. LB1]|uniref:TrkH family potassium uptake protein n=1 Tax=Salinisphaera sp. LB1 TaxID=2183911 RepID=UPI000D706DE4|nr:TrkH family potassium uptake protein [Salinisphaera sp. LB1]AWN14729.1 Potassium uptake protein TrkH [Salinisphaera sp. LB1]